MEVEKWSLVWRKPTHLMSELLCGCKTSPLVIPRPERSVNVAFVLQPEHRVLRRSPVGATGPWRWLTNLLIGQAESLTHLNDLSRPQSRQPLSPDGSVGPSRSSLPCTRERNRRKPAQEQSSGRMAFVGQLRCQKVLRTVL